MHHHHHNSSNKSRTLEFTVLSAEDLRLNRKPLSKNIFVVLFADSITHHTTSFQGNGTANNGFVSWNEKFFVDVAAHARCVTFEVKCKTHMGAVKDVGVARIAVSDFVGTVVPDHCLQFLSYRLRDWDGLRNGIINFSVRDVTPPLPTVVGGGGCGMQVVAGPSKINGGGGSLNGVVNGVPVWWNNHAQE